MGGTYPAFFFSNFKLGPHMGHAVFLNIGLTQTCIAIDVPPPPHGDLTKAQRRRQGNAKLIVRNKVFECTTLLKIEVIEYGKWVSKLLEMFLETNILMRGEFNPPSHTLPTSLLAPSVQAFGFQCPLRKQPLWVQAFLYIYFVVFSI